MVLIEQTGKITFLYHKVPELPFNFVDEHHPVTIGLADAHRQKVIKIFLNNFYLPSKCDHVKQLITLTGITIGGFRGDKLLKAQIPFIRITLGHTKQITIF